MADQPADGTVAAEQHNRLMGSYQRALGMLSPEQREALRTARPDAPEYAASQQWEPGTQLVVGDDGTLEEYEPPTPQNPNATNYAAGRTGTQPSRSGGDDGSAEWARANLFQELGYTPPRNPFTD